MNQPIYSEQAIRARCADRLIFNPDDQEGDYHLNPEMRDHIVGRAVKQAAVLIPLVMRDGEVQVILTKRAEKLKSHSGQVAFPGGKIDEDDASPEAAALREAWEEIGLDINEVEVLGRLPNYSSGSGFLISPVVGFVSAHADFEISPDEVDYMFEVPLSFLMNLDNHVHATRDFGERQWTYLEIPFDGHHIWGVTAGMIRVLHDRVFSHDAS